MSKSLAINRPSEALHGGQIYAGHFSRRRGEKLYRKRRHFEQGPRKECFVRNFFPPKTPRTPVDFKYILNRNRNCTATSKKLPRKHLYFGCTLNVVYYEINTRFTNAGRIRKQTESLVSVLELKALIRLLVVDSKGVS